MKRLNNYPSYSVNILFVATIGLSCYPLKISGRRGGLTVTALSSGRAVLVWVREPFLESPGTFRARNAIFSSSVVSTNGEVCRPETSPMKGTSVHIKNFEILLWLFAPEKFPGLLRNGRLARDITLCPCARHFTLTFSLPPGVYKWIPGNLMPVVWLRWTIVLSRED